MEPIVKYHCPVCDKEYDTPEEAEKCFVPLHLRFKQGDIFSFDYGAPLMVMSVLSETARSISAQRIPEFLKAENRMSRSQFERGSYIGAGLCSAKKYPLEDAKKLVSDLRRRLKNAEKFLEMVKKMYEEENK